MEADVGQRLVDFLERLFSKVGDAQQIFARAMQQIVDGEDTAFLETICRADRKAHLGRAHFETRVEVLAFFIRTVQWDTCHEGSLPYE